jgi:hypothetical protein
LSSRGSDRTAGDDAHAAIDGFDRHDLEPRCLELALEGRRGNPVMIVLAATAGAQLAAGRRREVDHREASAGLQ